MLEKMIVEWIVFIVLLCDRDAQNRRHYGYEEIFPSRSIVKMYSCIDEEKQHNNINFISGVAVI